MSALPKTATPDLLIGMIHDPLSWALWPAAKAMLTPALERGGEDWAKTEAALSADEMRLWAVIEDGTLTAATVTRISVGNRGEVVEVFLVGGEGYERWLAPLNDQIEQAARDIGCVEMRAWGRSGWKKPLAALGWSAVAVAYEKDLTHG